MASLSLDKIYKFKLLFGYQSINKRQVVHLVAAMGRVSSQSVDHQNRLQATGVLVDSGFGLD